LRFPLRMYRIGQNMNKHIREFQRMLQGGGLRLLSLTRTGKGHYKAQIQGADNKRMTYILANSASDHRAAANRDRDISRFFNN
jgi:hypothetical protein